MEQDLQMRRLERRALWLMLAGACLGGLVWGWGMAVSILIGGVLGFLNFLWMKRGVDRVLGQKRGVSTSSVVAGYLARFVLILVGLFAIIHFSFLSLYGALFGLSVFVLAGLLEAVGSFERKQ